jgi:spermidine synthase
MYHVISTGLVAISLYLISYFFFRIGYYPLQTHRKLWNTILASAFLLTAVAGIFLALQINYKWHVPFIKELLKWHVEFGIALAVTGVLHLTWHLDYYEKLFKRSVPVNGTAHSKNKITGIETNLFIAGFVSSSIQFLLMREMMNITGGYELITGSFLGSWLIGSAVGASLAGRSSFTDLKKINLIFSISPLISLFFIIFLSRVFLSPGETPSFLAAFIYTLIVLIPFCMVSGFTFIKLITIGKEQGFLAGESFSIETIGGLVSGIIISLLVTGFTGTYEMLLLIILLTIVYVLITFYFVSSKIRIVIKISALLVSFAIILLNPDLIFRQLLLPSITVTETKDTPYGNITRGKYKGEESLYYNQRLLEYSNDVAEREMDIHFALLQCKLPRKVILISGSLKSHLPEIFKYPVSEVIYIERDPSLASSEKINALKFADKVQVVSDDAFRYIKNYKDSADAVILLLPPPTTLLLNRYYTTEFFSEIRKKLSRNGVFMCSPGPGENYLNKEAINLYSSIYNSIASNFRYVKPVTGEKLYFIASGNPVSLSFCQLSEEYNIKNIYVSRDYLDDELINKKSEEVISLLDRGIHQNKSAYPVASFHFQRYQFSKNIGEKIPAIILMIVIFALPVFRVRKGNFLMYCSASALAGFEIIILLSLQIMIGNMYQLTGLVIAGFMAGLAAGSGIKSPLLDTISLRNKVILQVMFYIAFGMIYNFLADIKSLIPALAVILIAGFLPALITGRIFRELTLQIDGFDKSASVYSADLSGSALGFIFISGLAVPVFGIQVSVFLLAIQVCAGIIFGVQKNNK